MGFWIWPNWPKISPTWKFWNDRIFATEIGVFGHHPRRPKMASLQLGAPLILPGNKHQQTSLNSTNLVETPCSWQICSSKWVHLPPIFGVNICNIFQKPPPKTAWISSASSFHRFPKVRLPNLPKWRIRSQEPSQCTHHLPTSPGSVAATTVLGGNSFLRHGCKDCKEQQLRNEDDIYEDVFFWSCYLKSCCFPVAHCYYEILFHCNGWFCTHAKLSKNFFLECEFRKWYLRMIHSLPSLCLQNRLRWHEIPQLELLLIETHRSMHVAIFCPCQI